MAPLTQGRRGRSDDVVRRRWIVLGGLPLMLALLVAVRPNAFGNGRFFNLYNVAMLASVAVLVFGVWRWRPRPLWPWVMIALTIGLWVTGDLVYGSYASPPTVSFADVFYLAGYVTLVLGVLRLVRVGVGQRNADSILDMAIVGVAAMYASWALVIEPTWATERRLVRGSSDPRDLSGDGRGAARSARSTVARIATHACRTSSSLWGWPSCLRVTSASRSCSRPTSFTSWSILDASWPLGYAFIALSALHPSVRVPPRRDGRVSDRAVDPRRLLAASAAVLSIPTVVVIAYSLNGELDRMALMTASICSVRARLVADASTLRSGRDAPGRRSSDRSSTSVSSP